MKWQKGYLEKVLTSIASDEVTLLDTSALLEERTVQEVNYYTRLLEHTEGWFVTSGVLDELKFGIVHDGARRKDFEHRRFYNGEHKPESRNEHHKKELEQARLRKLKVLRAQKRDAYGVLVSSPEHELHHSLLLPRVEHHFREVHNGELHQVDVEIITVGLSHALKGEKVSLASGDSGLLKVFCDLSRVYQDSFKYAPHIYILQDEGFRSDAAKVNYKAPLKSTELKR
jgi:hypothetical protein